MNTITMSREKKEYLLDKGLKLSIERDLELGRDLPESAHIILKNVTKRLEEGETFEYTQQEVDEFIENLQEVQKDYESEYIDLIEQSSIDRLESPLEEVPEINRYYEPKIEELKVLIDDVKTKLFMLIEL